MEPGIQKSSFALSRQPCPSITSRFDMVRIYRPRNASLSERCHGIVICPQPRHFRYGNKFLHGRGEFFNAANRPESAAWSSITCGAAFGPITSTVANVRLVRRAVGYQF